MVVTARVISPKGKPLDNALLFIVDVYTLCTFKYSAIVMNVSEGSAIVLRLCCGGSGGRRTAKLADAMITNWQRTVLEYLPNLSQIFTILTYLSILYYTC